MATSGTVTFAPTELAVYTTALQDIGVLGDGQTARASDVVLCRNKLNMLVKQWVGQADFAPGLKMWTRRRAYLFLQKGQVEYDLGPGGDHTAEESYVTTTLTAASATSDTTLTVAAITGISSADVIGVELDTGYIHWTTVNGAPAGYTVTITTGVTSDASIGARVFAYTTKMRRPFEIVSAVLRDTAGSDTPIDPAMGVEEYEAIPTKSVSGTPYRMYIEPRRTTTTAFLDCSPDDATKVVRMVYLSYIEDLSTNAGDVDFPAEWIRPLAAQLAIDICPAFGRPVTPDLKLMRDESLSIAKNANPARSTAYFLSEPDAY